MGKLKLLLLVFLSFQFLLLSDVAYAVTNTSFKKGVGEAVWPLQATVCGENTACSQNYWNKVKELGITWLYNWSGWQGDYKPTWMTDNSVEYVPMIGGAGSGTDRTYTEYELSRFANYAGKNPGSYWLIWNEPDLFGLPAATAASIYDSLRNAIKGEDADPMAKLIVGNVTYEGRDWLNSFREAYKTTHNGVYPVVEGWGGHLYKGWSNYTSMQSWRDNLLDYRNWMVKNGEGSKEFWLTEFGSLTADSLGMQIMNDQLTWLEEQTWITRYAWFFAGLYEGAHPGERGSLFSNSIKDMTVDLSRLGARYASHPGTPPSYLGCPVPLSNCISEFTACPNGKAYDRLKNCPEGLRCCNPNLTPTPTSTPIPTPTFTPTPATSKGWNRLALTNSFSSSSFPTCTITENRTSFWRSFVIGQLQNRTYYLICRD